MARDVGQSDGAAVSQVRGLDRQPHLRRTAMATATVATQVGQLDVGVGVRATRDDRDDVVNRHISSSYSATAQPAPPIVAFVHDIAVNRLLRNAR